MEIKISAAEYFGQLQLMEKQYGQEEDLYPWIYMLLQSSNAKLSKKLSIRDVHNARRVSYSALNEKDDLWDIRWEIIKRVGAPDIVFLSDDNSILGCVEIKKLNTLEGIMENKVQVIINENAEQWVCI